MDRDLWKYYPIQQQVTEPSPTSSVPAMPPDSPEEGASKNEFDNGLGRGPDDRNKRERKEVEYKKR